MLSIVVPTYNEAENIPALLDSIDQQLTQLDIEYEVLIADDHSDDGTSAVIEALCTQFNVQLVPADARPRDLSLSVIGGVRASKYDTILVMDADLSHPVTAIKPMLDEIQKSPDTLVLGSRYVSGGSFDRGWSMWRFINSYVATLIAKPLSSSNDPMSGFVMFRKEHVDLEKLNPIGYKIALELIVRGGFSSVQEVPISFQDRKIGESKMNMQQQVNYLRHIRRLYLYKFGSIAEFVHFGAVGASGFVVDLTFYFLFQWLGMNHVAARACSFWPAVSWNWALNRVTTFGEREKRPKTRQWFEFVGTSLFGFSLNWGAYTYLTSEVAFFAEYKVLALMSGIVCASFFNFAASSLFVYSDKRSNKD